MAHLRERFCPKCKKSMGQSVVDLVCNVCADRWCKDCRVKRPVHYGRCTSCNATYVHKRVEEAHKRAQDSKLRFGSKI